MANSLMEKSQLVESLTNSHHDELSKVKIQLDQAVQDCKKEQQKVFELEHTVSTLNRENAALSMKCTSFESRIEELLTESSWHQKSGQDDEKTGSSVEAEFEKLKVSYDSLLARCNCTEGEVSTLRQEKEELQKRVSELVTEKVNLEAASNMAAKALMDIDSDLRNQLSCVEQSIQSENGKMKASVALTEDSVLDKDFFREAKMLVVKHIAELQSKHSLVTAENVQKVAVVSDFKVKVDSLTEELEMTKEMLSQSKLSSANDAKQRSVLEKELEEFKSANTDLMSKLNNQSEQAVELQQQLVNIHTAHEQLQTSHQQLTEGRDKFYRQSTDLQDSLDQLRTRHDELLLDYDRIVEESNTINTSLEALRQQQIIDINSQQQSNEV